MVKYNDAARHVHRPAPCPTHDIYGMEAWLEDMAKEGLLLARDGFFLGFADFEVSKPTQMKYRLQAAQKARKSFDYNEPEDGEAELMEAMGWEFVARRGEFHIYRSADPSAPELNTDPRVQAITLKAVGKRLPNHLVSMLLWLVIYPIFFFDEGLVRATIATGSAFAIFSIIMLAWIVISDLRAIFHIRRIRKCLEAGERPEPVPHSRQKALRHLSWQCAYIMAAIVWFILIVLMFFRVGNAEFPLSDFEGEPPFATIADFYPEGAEVEREDFMGIYDNYEYLSDPIIAPESIIWREMADITLPDGSSRDATMILYYHEMSSEILAKIVAWEFLRDAKGEKYYEEVALPDLGVDFCAAYKNHVINPCSVLIRQGNIVVEATVRQHGQAEPVPLTDWAQVLADSIKE